MNPQLREGAKNTLRGECTKFEGGRLHFPKKMVGGVDQLGKNFLGGWR